MTACHVKMPKHFREAILQAYNPLVAEIFLDEVPFGAKVKILRKVRASVGPAWLFSDVLSDGCFGTIADIVEQEVPEKTQATILKRIETLIEGAKNDEVTHESHLPQKNELRV